MNQYDVAVSRIAQVGSVLGVGQRHTSFVVIIPMTPDELKNGRESLCINIFFGETPFGKALFGSTAKGMCYLFFDENEGRALESLKCHFPYANYVAQSDAFQRSTMVVLQQGLPALGRIPLHIKGTAFQLSVWSALLLIPVGKLCSYGYVAQQINRLGAARAVGTAVGANPVAFLIPCHRVVQAGGGLGGYRWGVERKVSMIDREAALV